MKAVVTLLAQRGQLRPGRRTQPTGRAVAADATPSPYRSAEGGRAFWTVRGCLLVQIALFLVLVSLHLGLLPGGSRHRAAGITEAGLTAVLVVGLLLTWTPAPGRRRAATAAQSFGILGVLVGLFTITLGIVSRTILDLSLNAVLLLTLVAGLALTKRGEGGVHPVGMV